MLQSRLTNAKNLGLETLRERRVINLIDKTVGFIKSKRNSTQTQVVSPTKVPNANNGDENEGPVKKRQRRSIDDTIDSSQALSLYSEEHSQSSMTASPRSRGLRANHSA
ncbi:CMF_collapsed_G0013190.mRNA.1.CDS.1 [Saccharomyces cerevisiae]|nr:CMF_collapsed_G0013190.mRNA.1.CDS.1 [Saccharomyces cerevisiae]